MIVITVYGIYHCLHLQMQMAFSYVIMQCLPELNMDNLSSVPWIGTVRDLLFGTKR